MAHSSGGCPLRREETGAMWRLGHEWRKKTRKEQGMPAVAGLPVLPFVRALGGDEGNRERQQESNWYCDSNCIIILQPHFHQAGMINPMIRWAYWGFLNTPRISFGVHGCDYQFSQNKYKSTLLASRSQEVKLPMWEGREEEILALIQKQNHDCSENFVAKGNPSVPAKDLGLEDGRNCDTFPFLPKWQPGLALDWGGRRSRGLSANQVLFIWGHVSWIFWDGTNFL